MTEEEAKTKWCPHARAMISEPNGKPATRSPPYNRMVFDAPGGSDDWIDYPETLCIASACMAWRWNISPREAAQAAKDAPITHGKSPFVEDGFCGLAGAPQ